MNRFEGAEKSIRKLLGDELTSKLGPIWDLNEEGEERGAWRWLGLPNLWFMMGAWRPWFCSLSFDTYS